MNITIADRIKLRRKELDLSPEYIAQQLGVSRATYYRYESGYIKKFPASLLIPLSKILNTTTEYLINAPLYQNFTEIDELKKCTFSVNEIKLIKKYRQLDADGKQRIENQLNFEVEQLKDKESAPSGAAV